MKVKKEKEQRHFESKWKTASKVDNMREDSTIPKWM